MFIVLKSQVFELNDVYDVSLVISPGLPWHLKFMFTWYCVLFSRYLVVLLACISTFSYCC